ncbi:MAG: YvrJ family protein [Candidatus Paceibacterota bacterium]
MEEILLNIANYGFSIVVAVYLLIRTENKIEKLTESINELNKTIIKMKN